MPNQYCKVGTVKPLKNEEQSIALLEYLYQNFETKANSIMYADTKLGEFFANKAQKFEKLLNDLCN